MWNVETTDDFERKHRQFEKKHIRELTAVLENLQRYLNALNEGGRPETIKFGFVHNEPKGVKAIDQKGGGSNLRQTRLYTYAYLEGETVYLITLGDKKSQSADIKLCNSFVDKLRESDQPTQ